MVSEYKPLELKAVKVLVVDRLYVFRGLAH